MALPGGIPRWKAWVIVHDVASTFGVPKRHHYQAPSATRRGPKELLGSPPRGQRVEPARKVAKVALINVNCSSQLERWSRGIERSHGHADRSSRPPSESSDSTRSLLLTINVDR